MWIIYGFLLRGSTISTGYTWTNGNYHQHNDDDDDDSTDEIYGLIFNRVPCTVYDSICRFAFLSSKINKLAIHIFTFHNFYKKLLSQDVILACSSWKTRIKFWCMCYLKKKKKKGHVRIHSVWSEWKESESSAYYACCKPTNHDSWCWLFLVSIILLYLSPVFKMQVSMLITLCMA